MGRYETFRRPKSRVRSAGWHVVCLSLLVAGAAGAEGSAAEDGADTTQLHRVEGEILFVEESLEAIPASNTIAAKFPLSLRRTPASVSVVGAPLIEQQGAGVLGDALENVSGVNVQTGSGVFDFFVVRGFDSVSSGMILVDGAREPEASFYQLYNVERVEVFKGPSAFIYGGSPLAGTVNLVRKQPLASDFSRFAGRFGSFGTFGGTIDANLASVAGNASFRLASMWRDSDNFRDDKSNRSVAVNPSLAWRWGERAKLNLTLEHLGLDYRSDSGLPILSGGGLPDVPRTRSYQSPFDTSEQEIDRLQVDLEHRLGKRLVLRNKTYYRRLDWRSLATIFNGVQPTPGGSLEAARSLLSLDDRQEFVGNQLELIAEATTGKVEHHLLFGLELARLADEFDFGAALLPAIDLFDPLESASEPLLPIPGQARSGDSRSQVTAPYLVDQIDLSQRLELFVGLRLDLVDFDDEASGISRRDEELSPMLGVVFSPIESLSLYAHAAGAFAPPSTLTVAEAQVPEESTQYEVGAKQSLLGGRVEAAVAAYRLERDNIAIPDEDGLIRQTGDQRSTGVEFELTAALQRRWRLHLAYAFTDGELTRFADRVQVGLAPPAFVTVDRSGNTPAFTPEHLLNLWVSKGLGAGFDLGLGGRYVGEQFIAEDNAFALDDYLLFDAAVSYSRGPWVVSVNLENLTDEDYLTRGFGATSVIPAPGLAASGSVQYTF